MVEEPLRDLLGRWGQDGESLVTCGRITVIATGEEPVRIDALHQPWRLGQVDPEGKEMYEKGLKEANHRGLVHADIDLGERTGVISGEQGERVLLVKLNDSCEHDSNQWVETDCGHVWCPMYDGFVDPMVRTALKGAGPIISCN